MDKRRIRPLWVLCLVLVVGWLGPACAGGSKAPPQPDEPPPAAAGREIVTIRMLILGQDPALDTTIGAFYDTYVSYRITKELLPLSGGDITEQIAARIRQGEIDVVQVDGRGADLAKLSLLEPLDYRMLTSGLDPAPFGQVLADLRYAGQAYELPTTFQPQLLAYNPDLFAAAGLPVPPASGWTWAEFREAARRLTSGEGNDRVWGFSAPLVEQLAWAWFMERSDPATGAIAPTDLREGLEFFRQMVFADRSVPRAEKRNWAGGIPQYAQTNDFSDGKAAMGLQRLPYWGSWRNQAMEWEVAPLPTRTGRAAPLSITPHTFAIALGSTRKEAAWDFLRFAAGLRGATASARSGALPVYNSPSVQEEWFRTSPVPPRSTVLAFTLPRRIVGSGSTPAAVDRYRLVNAAVNGVLSGARTVDEAYSEYLQQTTNSGGSSP